MLVQIIILLLLFILATALYITFGPSSQGCIEKCAEVHSTNGKNYPWLSDIHGGVQRVQFMEPISSGVWTEYTDKIWKIHCKVIDHNPANLVASHMAAFVNPETRSIKLNFIFNDGTQMEPTQEFYEREAAYFSNQKICA
jgi:hypothetical protein